MFKPSKQQIRFFNWIEEESGNCILEAVAGAGKTTTLLHGCTRMNGTVWIGVFNKKLADEIKMKLTSDDDPFGSESHVHTSTFHAAGFAALRRTGKYRVEADKCATIAKRLIDLREGIDQLQNQSLRMSSSLALRLVSLAKNRLLSPDDTDAWIDLYRHHDLQSPVPDLVIGFAQDILRESLHTRGVIDFDDMIYLPVILDLRCRQYDWVLVDEAQDTNPARRALAGKMLKPSGRFIAVGDPRQAIYGFTGADNDALDQLRQAYMAITIPLSTTFRCPRKVVEYARSFGATLEAAEDAPEGIVDTMSEIDAVDQLDNMTSEERRNSVILCRTTRHLVRLCFRFIHTGIPARIEGRSIGQGLIKLATRWKITNLSDLSDRLEDYRSREVEKAIAAEQEAKAEWIIDQVTTLQLLIELTNKNNGHTLSDLTDMIEDMFEDGVSSKGMLTLCTVHRSKGLEWDTVYLLGRSQLMPSPWAQQEWQIDQENNLIYVAITRALRRFVDMTLDIRPS